MTTVTVQYQEPRRPYRWVSAFRARVLYADKQIVLVRGAGSHSSFYSDGQMRNASYNRKHPAAQLIPERTRSWRLHPESVARLNG